MLCELRINNLALIETLNLTFEGAASSGLVVMTGETGAGKSIMLRAIHLLTGGRASADWIRSGADSCIIEALFEVNEDSPGLVRQLEESGFRADSSLIIKRIISQNGRSKFYINGSLATAKFVSEITRDLLTVASQHDHQKLLQPALHLDFLDTYGELLEARSEVGDAYRIWQVKRNMLSDLRKEEQGKEQRKDFLEFQLAEIDEAQPYVGEDEELSQEKKRLKNSDSLMKLSQESYYLLSGDISEKMLKLRKGIEQLAAIDPDLEKLAEDISGYTYQAEDYVVELRNYRDSLESNPLRLEQVTERLDILLGLKRKYGEQLEDVIAFAENARAELEGIESMDKRIVELEEEVAGLEQQVCRSAGELTGKRRKAAAAMEKAMGEELMSLAFKQSGLKVRWHDFAEEPGNLSGTGWDKVEFFFSANPGEPERPLAKVASGGELSRLLLAMKCLLAQKDMVDTVIFDEVDAGIGGEAAEAVARKIKELAGHHQVFCITHLPQIAARGDIHFEVSKSVENERTQSRVVKLKEEQRVHELARMMAGESVTPMTKILAEEMLGKGVESI